MPENSRCPWVFMVVCGEGWGGCDSWWQREAPGLAYQPVLVQREGPGLKQQCAVRQQIRESGCWVYKAKIICYYGGKEWPALSTWLLGGMFPEDKPLVDQELLWLPEDQDFILRFIYVYFYVCGCFACVCCVSVLTAYMLIHAWCLRKPGEGVGPSGTRVTDICEPPWMLGTESQYSTRTATAPSSSQNLAFVFFFSVWGESYIKSRFFCLTFSLHLFLQERHRWISSVSPSDTFHLGINTPV